MFEHWDSYYILVGSASGALIGLLFVVATLQSGRDPEASARGRQHLPDPDGVPLHRRAGDQRRGVGARPAPLGGRP